MTVASTATVRREWPQSNQRGIEIKFDQLTPTRRIQGLNRTSVGLKWFRTRTNLRPAAAPQSNQRGIEMQKAGAYVNVTPMASIEPAWD